MKLSEIPTPALIVDAAVVRNNLSRLAAYSVRHNLAIRPHTKTHKSRRLAEMQIASGCQGLTMAKVGEAEALAEVCDDLLVAYPALDEYRAGRIAQLAANRTLRVAVDSTVAVAAISLAARNAGTTVGLLVDLDVGMGRTGVQSADEAWRLAEKILSASHVRLNGLFCYPGHIWLPAEQQAQALAEVSTKLAEALAIWKSHGVEAKIVSGGSTPTAYQSHLVPQYTEIRPGTYIFNDMNTVRGGWCTLQDCVARLVCTVVSNSVPGQVIIDAGSKTLTSDRCIPAPESGHGYLVEYPDATISKLSEEHGQVDIRKCQKVPALGERITVIPNHVCPCVNLQDTIWWHEGDLLSPLPVDARGKLN